MANGHRNLDVFKDMQVTRKAVLSLPPLRLGLSRFSIILCRSLAMLLLPRQNMQDTMAFAVSLAWTTCYDGDLPGTQSSLSFLQHYLDLWLEQRLVGMWSLDQPVSLALELPFAALFFKVRAVQLIQRCAVDVGEVRIDAERLPQHQLGRTLRRILSKVSIP